MARNDAGVDYAAREKERESGHKVPLHAAPALRRTAVMHEARARARPVVTLVKRIVPLSTEHPFSFPTTSASSSPRVGGVAIVLDRNTENLSPSSVGTKE